jgi:DNA-binding response OmpR family regulator
MSKILIIADDDSVRKKLKYRIEAMGHETEEATCLQTAEKCLNRSNFDCVLLDLCIPVRFEGVGRIKYGKTLLQRIMNGEEVPAVISIAAQNGLDHSLSMAMMEIEANNFIIQPFDENSIEPKINLALAKAAQQNVRKTFKGGVLMLSKDGIELRGQIVGGVKGKAYIRRIIETLGQKTAKGDYRKMSAKRLAALIGSGISAASITSAIKNFRHNCCFRLGCEENDVIQTNPCGGYQLAPSIEFQLKIDLPLTLLGKDKQAVLRQLKKRGRCTRRQISDNTGVPSLRLKYTLSALIEEKAIVLIGRGSTAAYKISAKTKRRRKQ